jgi:ADP-ribosylglycohydrolase
MLNGSTPARAFIEGLRLAHIPLSIPSPPRGSGFVLDSLAFAIHAARSSWTYEETMLNAIRLGADTDTTAAIAGGLLGVRDGYEAIPSAWMTDLRGKGYASEIIDAFVNARHNV